MKLNRPLVFVLYTMVALMIVMPLGETLLSIWPLRMGEAAWRFGAAGLFSRALMTPLLGLVLLWVIAFLLGHRRAVITTAVVAALGALVLALAEGMFVLDAVQMRAQVREEAKLAFDLASLLALFKIGMSFLVASVLAWGSWKMTRGVHGVRAPRENRSAALMRDRLQRQEAEAPLAAAASPQATSTQE